jgi:hypothetical protein
VAFGYSGHAEIFINGLPVETFTVAAKLSVGALRGGSVKQARGTLIPRPPASATVKSSSVTSTGCASGFASTTEELIPHLGEPLPVLIYETLRSPQLGNGKATRRGQGDRLEPGVG